MNQPAQPPQPLSLWSLTALACSVGLCPVVTLLGVVLGFFALRDIRQTGRRGRRIAIAAIIMGSIVTPLVTVGLIGWNNWVREPLLKGPIGAIQAGQAGDIQGFMDAFEGGTAAEASTFLQSLGTRYGTLVSIMQDPDGEAVWTADGGAIQLPYQLQFSQNLVSGTAEYVLLDRKPEGGIPSVVMRFSWIRIGEDPVLVFPATARDEALNSQEDDDVN
ncbi:MAG: DUF4190 domain-containing protein [Phycisphaerales bacterium]|nr:DUF4190 domain-containing protein [Phycisphaerales bacterium]